jgi:predicted HAD superfamily phosphohydrolase YqeG
MRLPENHIYVSHEEAADRIEQLEKAVDILQAAMVAKKPIPLRFKKAITEARAALENKNEQSAED